MGILRSALGALTAVVIAAGVVCGTAWGADFSRAPGPWFPLGAQRHAGAVTFASGEPVVGATYFYWYNVDTGAHIVDSDGTDALTTHPADMKGASFARAAWHRRQFLDMIDAGLDFCMPVYWGVPGDYDGWSFRGLPPLVEAHEGLLKEGKRAPAIGLFYDTSILQYNNVGRIDLATEAGKDWFYTAMRDFFSLIPPSKWARVDGRPIVFLYAAAFAKGQDPAQMEYVRRRFRADFGVEPFIVKHRDWQGEADAIYQWGGAVAMQIDEHVAAIGPGYDHSAVPGRTPLIVDREGGDVYRQRWERLLASSPARRPWMVHVETWNEWHEGTDIAESREYGRTYIDLTRKYAGLFRQGVQMPITGAYAGSAEVTWSAVRNAGLSLRPSGGDGEWEIVKGTERPFAVTRANDFSSARYLYFCVDDSFAWDADATFVITVRYRDGGCEAFEVQYDNTDVTQGPVQGAFRSSAAVKIGGTVSWQIVTLKLPQCRFVDRCNGADLRLAPVGGALELAVSEVVLRREQPLRADGVGEGH